MSVCASWDGETVLALHCGEGDRYASWVSVRE